MLKTLGICVVCFTLSSLSLTSYAQEAKAEKEWTFLTFLNGHNNLDSYGKLNINQMEAVGSSDQVNVVVQWASSASSTTKRLYVKKDSDKTNVTSPVVQSLPRVDMGDYKNLIDFVKWGIQNYPAKHYFINVWNHGAGWHRISRGASRDISVDDFTSHKITTAQLGLAINEISKTIGRKVDMVGADACLMAMAEVTGEMSAYAEYFVGSQETEPGEGWPYEGLLKRWTLNPQATGKQVGTILVEEYIKAATAPDVTMSALDLNQTKLLESAVSTLGKELSNLSTADWAKVKTATASTVSFAYSDYVDLYDLVAHLAKTRGLLSTTALEGVKSAVNQFVVSNGDGASYQNAHGVSIWWPKDEYDYTKYRKRYNDLIFNQMTHWGEAIDARFAKP